MHRLGGLPAASSASFASLPSIGSTPTSRPSSRRTDLLLGERPGIQRDSGHAENRPQRQDRGAGDRFPRSSKPIITCVSRRGTSDSGRRRPHRASAKWFSSSQRPRTQRKNDPLRARMRNSTVRRSTCSRPLRGRSSSLIPQHLSPASERPATAARCDRRGSCGYATHPTDVIPASPRADSTPATQHVPTPSSTQPIQSPQTIQWDIWIICTKLRNRVKFSGSPDDWDRAV